MLADDVEIGDAVARDALRSDQERRLLDHDEAQRVLRYQLPLAGVIQAALLAPSDTGHRLTTVEERRRLRVLLLLELDDESERRPVSVYRKLRAERACW
ncbi:hypothetical protein [Microbacterium sp.]|uniref:hypothetical protein n=1 Tax=Microbacterium sp. TaxID=51671 RepID=UPI0026015044|nr:hypothetical protein [Microbacterium sp.]